MIIFSVINNEHKNGRLVRDIAQNRFISFSVFEDNNTIHRLKLMYNNTL